MNFYINGERIYSSLEEKPGRVGLTGGSFIWNTDLRYDNYVFVDEGCPLSGQLFESGVPEFAPPIPSPYQELKAPNR